MFTPILPNGLPLPDTAIVSLAMQKWSAGEMDPGAVFERLSATRKHPISKAITISKTGKEPVLVTGDHPALHYRGHALKRHKIWAQTDYLRGLLKYGYTGWQHAVSAATRDVVAYPDLNNMLKWLNANFSTWLAECGLAPQTGVFNHVIFTRYEDEKDFIGMHADKESDFIPGTYIVVFKLGCARDFAFSHDDDIFWQDTLAAGTAIIMKTGTANACCKHGVPVSRVPVGPSGSIVFRCIKTVVPWPDVKRNIARAMVQKKKRLLKKQDKRPKKRAKSRKSSK